MRRKGKGEREERKVERGKIGRGRDRGVEDG